jgi:pimeloyl-ACP methyl ester carboxylesterase
VTNRGVRIHYETIGNGPALVMHHGTFGSGADWIDLGYVDALKADHQVILPDSWGHGQSDKPHDPTAYDLALRTSDVLAVLDELGIQKADYFGYSLGGWIGFDLAKHAPDRFRSFIFGAAHPYAESMQPFRDLMPRDRDAFAAMVDQVIRNRLTPAMRTRASPWQNGFAERLIGSIRRECLDHIIVLGEAHLRQILQSYARYYNEIRTHRSLDKDAPVARQIQRIGSIKSNTILGGLHHHYVRA